VGPTFGRVFFAALLLVTSSCQSGASGPGLGCGPAPTTSAHVSGATAVSTTDIWAVGTFQDENVAARPLAEHWDGTRWTQVPAPVGDWTFGARLFAVASARSDAVWAVGNGQNIGEEKTLIERWDGKQWTIVASPNASIRTNDLNAIAVVAEDDIWAVGEYYGPDKTLPLTEHWDGSAWSIVPAPAPAASLNRLSGVAAVSSHDVWAVGFQRESNGATPKTLIEHWDGTSWNVVSGKDPGDSSELTNVVALAPDDIWATGSSGGGDRSAPLIEHWNGRSWAVGVSPHASNVQVNTIAALSGSEIWLGGAVSDGHGDEWLLQRWDGKTWTAMMPSSGSTGAVGAIVGLAGGTAWAVGGYRESVCGADQALIQRWDGSRWTYVPSAHDGRQAS
jgi:hypothetical protein